MPVKVRIEVKLDSFKGQTIQSDICLLGHLPIYISRSHNTDITTRPDLVEELVALVHQLELNINKQKKEALKPIKYKGFWYRFKNLMSY